MMSDDDGVARLSQRTLVNCRAWSGCGCGRSLSPDNMLDKTSYLFSIDSSSSRPVDISPWRFMIEGTCRGARLIRSHVYDTRG